MDTSEMNYEKLTGWDAMCYASEMDKIYQFSRFIRTFKYYLNESGKIGDDFYPQYADLEITGEDTIKISVKISVHDGESEEKITFENSFWLIELMYELLKQFFETGERNIFESHYLRRDNYEEFMSNIMSEEEFRIKNPDAEAESKALLLLSRSNESRKREEE
jgi:hypothetical protein